MVNDFDKFYKFFYALFFCFSIVVYAFQIPIKNLIEMKVVTPIEYSYFEKFYRTQISRLAYSQSCIFESFSQNGFCYFLNQLQSEERRLYLGHFLKCINFLMKNNHDVILNFHPDRMSFRILISQIFAGIFNANSEFCKMIYHLGIQLGKRRYQMARFCIFLFCQ